MNTEISLSTFPGATVKAQYDAIANSTSISSSGVFAGGVVTITKGYILHIAQAYGMIKGRFFKLAETEKSVPLASGSTTLKGCLYIHMDLSNADDPIKLVVFTGEALPVLVQDENVNYNNSTYDVMVSTFDVSNLEVSNLVNKDITIKPVGDGAGTISRVTSYTVGQYGLNKKTPGWVTMCCTTAGTTASVEPSGYSTVTKIGDTVTDGTAIFTVRNLFGELDTAQTDITSIKTQIGSSEGVTMQVISLADYRALSSYGANTVYIVYEGSDTSNVTRIYIGEHATYTAGADVTYHIDTDSSSTQHIAYGIDALASAPTATKTGYTFLGWRADSQALTSVISSKIIDDETAVNLYAVFTSTTGIVLSFDGAGGSGTMDAITSSGSVYNNGNSLSTEITLPESSYTSTDNGFIGWSLTTGATADYVPGDKVTIQADTTAKAVWTVKKYECAYSSSNTEMYYDRSQTKVSGNGSVYVYIAPATGIYKLNAWGASGLNATALGGKGGHVEGCRKFTKGDSIHFYCGNTGTSAKSAFSTHISSAQKTDVSTNKYVYQLANGIDAQIGSYTSSSTYYYYGMGYSDLNSIYMIAGAGGAAVDSNIGGAGGSSTAGDGTGGKGGNQSGRGTYAYSDFGSPISVSSATALGGYGYHAGESSTTGSAGGGSSYTGGVSEYIDGVKYDITNESGVNDGTGKASIEFIKLA